MKNKDSGILTNRQKVLKIIKTVENHYQVVTNVRSQEHVFLIPRQIAMYVIYKNVDISLAKIGSYYGRTHATVINALNQVKDILESKSKVDDRLKMDIEQIEKAVEKELNLTLEQVERLNATEEILEIIKHYNILGLNNLKQGLILIPN
jgi:predicted transcriptional regulator